MIIKVIFIIDKNISYLKLEKRSMLKATLDCWMATIDKIEPNFFFYPILSQPSSLMVHNILSFLPG